MRQLLFMIMIFSISSVHGQSGKLINIPTYKNYKNELDTSLWFKWNHDLAKQIAVKDLQTSTDTFHFRFWTDIQAIDLWTVDHRSYFGSVTNYAQRYDDKLLRKGIYKVGKIYLMQISLDSSKARQLYNTLERLSILSIPTDEKIKGWQAGLDGEEFLIEISSPKTYDFKTYWTPRAFADTLKEAKQIQNLVDYLYTDLKISGYYQQLRLPEGSYKREGVQGIQVRSPQKQEPIRTTSILDLL